MEPVSPELTQGFLDVGGDWFIATNADNIITWCHKSSGARDAILPENLVGKPLASFLQPVHKDAIYRLIDPQSALPGVRRVMDFTDEYGDAYYLAAAGNWREQVFLGCYLIVQKMDNPPSPKPAGSEQLAAQLRQQELIADIATELAGGRDLETTLRLALSWIGGFLEVDHCGLFKHNPDSVTYNCVCEWRTPGRPPADATLSIPYNREDEDYIQRVTQPHIIVNDTAQGNWLVQRKFGVGAFADIAVVVGKAYWGFFGVHVLDKPRCWSGDEVRLLKTAADLISTALDKQAVQEKLLNTLIQMQEIVKGYPGIIWALDDKQVFTICEGRAMFSIAGDKDFVGCRLDECRGIIPEALFGGAHDTLDKGPQRYFFETQGGRTLLCDTTPLQNWAGEVSGVLGVALDVTDMHAMQKQMEEATAQARHASRAKGDFLARMSHEIRTPINAIVGMTLLAKQSGDPERITYCLEKIGAASSQLLGIINDILDMSKIESGKLEISPYPFDLSALLENLAAMMQLRIAEKYQRFTVDSKGLPNRSLIGDELRLSQVITNLLTNAVKFTPEQGEITLSVRAEEEILYVAVKDNGIGIEKSQQERLFESFEQADRSITRRFGGTGLGLAISREIVALMGGSLEVESEPGKGATFRFSVAADWGEELDAPKAHKEREVLPDWRGRRFLVAEDIAVNREIVAGILEETGISLDFAGTGAEAVDLFRQREGGYDLVLMDVHMPEMDGMEATRAIRESGLPAAGTVPIIAMTASAFREDIEHCLESGMNAHVAKPFSVESLYATLSGYLS